MLLGPGEFLSLRKKARRELRGKGYNVIMEDDEETKYETRLDIRFKKIMSHYDPVFIALFPTKAKNMEAVVFEIGCICCAYAGEEIGERLLLLSNKKYNYCKC